MPPWRDWYHCMGNTYGTWLPGDRRGFRTEHHKRHVPYDYKNPPPPGMYDALYRRSKALMTRLPVYLESREQRLCALTEFVGSLLRRDVPVAAASIDRMHFHALVRCHDRDPRHWIGLAKRESSHYCKATGDAPVGGIWGDGSECQPVADGGHYFNTNDYIASHGKYGAVVYLSAAPLRMPSNPLADFDPNDLLIE